MGCNRCSPKPPLSLLLSLSLSLFLSLSLSPLLSSPLLSPLLSSPLSSPLALLLPLPSPSLLPSPTLSLLSPFSPSQFFLILISLARLRKKEEPPCGSPNSLGNNGHSEKALCSQENYTFEGGSQVFCWPKCTFLSGPFLSCRHPPLFPQESGHSEVPFTDPWRHSSIPWEKLHILLVELL